VGLLHREDFVKLTLKLYLRHILWLIRSRFTRYTVAPTSPSFRRSILRKHNQRRERGNVALYLGKRGGIFHATR
jgi:GT2 family glycosyltransferase